jgi:hypothetical protein
MSNIIILAVSRKNNGFCVAGKDVNTNQWVRLVSSVNGGPLYCNQIAFQALNGGISNGPLFKILNIQLGQHVPLVYQPENYLLSGIQWQEANLNIQNTNFSYDVPLDIWGNSDRIDQGLIQNRNIIISQSLYFIKGVNINLYYTNFEGKLRRRISFDYNNLHYDLAATMNNRIFDDIQHGNTQHNNYLTLSLGEAWNGDHYKLVAGIF